MLNRLKRFLFPTTQGFQYNPVDLDGDGIVQEGTPFERKIEVVAKPKKATVKKKAVAKKAPVKKAVAKKTAAKKPVKKTAKKVTKKK